MCPNKRARGQVQLNSLIDRNGLGPTVLELHSKGTSYIDISRILWEKYSIKVSKMAIGRYLQRDHKDIEPNTIRTSIDTIRGSVIQRTFNLSEDWTKMFEDTKNIIDISNMSGIDKSNLKKIIEAKQKTIMQDFVASRSEIGLIFDAIQKNTNGVTELLMNFSKSLDPDGRKRIVDLIKEYENKHQ